MNPKSETLSAYIYIARHMSAMSGTVDKHSEICMIMLLNFIHRLFSIPHYANEILGCRGCDLESCKGMFGN